MVATARRLTLPIIAVLVLGLVGAGCSSTNDAAPDDADDEPTTPTTELCVPFPMRDANVMLEAPSDTRLAGNDEFTGTLLEMGTAGLVEDAPPSIRGAVETYVAALRDWEPGEDLRADPEIRTAVEDINAWLAANCGPPTGSVPSATTPGTAG